MAAESFPLGLILLFPALGVIFNLFFGPRVGRRAVNTVGAATIAAAFAVGVIAFVQLLAMPPWRGPGVHAMALDRGRKFPG